LLPTDDGIEKVSIEEFQVALAARQLMLLTRDAHASKAR